MRKLFLALSMLALCTGAFAQTELNCHKHYKAKMERAEKNKVSKYIGAGALGLSFATLGFLPAVFLHPVMAIVAGLPVAGGLGFFSIDAVLNGASFKYGRVLEMYDDLVLSHDQIKRKYLKIYLDRNLNYEVNRRRRRLGLPDWTYEEAFEHFMETNKNFANRYSRLYKSLHDLNFYYLKHKKVEMNQYRSYLLSQDQKKTFCKTKKTLILRRKKIKLKSYRKILDMAEKHFKE